MIHTVPKFVSNITALESSFAKISAWNWVCFQISIWSFHPIFHFHFVFGMLTKKKRETSSFHCILCIQISITLSITGYAYIKWNWKNFLLNYPLRSFSLWFILLGQKVLSPFFQITSPKKAVYMKDDKVVGQNVHHSQHVWFIVFCFLLLWNKLHKTLWFNTMSYCFLKFCVQQSR